MCPLLRVHAHLLVSAVESGAQRRGWVRFLQSTEGRCLGAATASIGCLLPNGLLTPVTQSRLGEQRSRSTAVSISSRSASTRCASTELTIGSTVRSQCLRPPQDSPIAAHISWTARGTASRCEAMCRQRQSASFAAAATPDRRQFRLLDHSDRVPRNRTIRLRTAAEYAPRCDRAR